MALLAEALVDEWLNRQNFFTIRGLKEGVHEIDLLAVRKQATGLEGWHVEVQASFRPIGYISKLPTDRVAGFAKVKTSMKKRPLDLLEKCVIEWVHTKFLSKKMRKLHEWAWPGLSWKSVLVHAEVRNPEELVCIRNQGVHTVSLDDVLEDLKHDSDAIRGGAGTDISEIVEYYYARKTHQHAGQ